MLCVCVGLQDFRCARWHAQVVQAGSQSVPLPSLPAYCRAQIRLCYRAQFHRKGLSSTVPPPYRCSSLLSVPVPPTAAKIHDTKNSIVLTEIVVPRHCIVVPRHCDYGVVPRHCIVPRRDCCCTTAVTWPTTIYELTRGSEAGRSGGDGGGLRGDGIDHGHGSTRGRCGRRSNGTWRPRLRTLR